MTRPWIKYDFELVMLTVPLIDLVHFFRQPARKECHNVSQTFWSRIWKIYILLYFWWVFAKTIVSFLSLKRLISQKALYKSELRLQKEFDYSFWQHLQLLTRGDRHKNMYLLYAWLGKHFLSKIDERMALCCFVKQSSSSTIKEYWGVIQSQFYHSKFPTNSAFLWDPFVLFTKSPCRWPNFAWSPKWLIIRIKWIRLWLSIICKTPHYFYYTVM